MPARSRVCSEALAITSIADHRFTWELQTRPFNVRGEAGKQAYAIRGNKYFLLASSHRPQILVTSTADALLCGLKATIVHQSA